jgi:hypothetical protein
MLSTLFPIITEDRAVQLPNVESLMLSTVSGMVTELNDVLLPNPLIRLTDGLPDIVAGISYDVSVLPRG